MRTIKTVLMVLCLWNIAQAQINTPMPSIPFGTGTYAYGILPTNLPSGGTYGASQDAATAYNTWKTNYISDCGDGTCRVNFDNPSQTVSEGIAYGMLISVYAGDKALFDCLWGYYKKFSNGNGVMNWRIDGCSSAIGTGGAADAEIDAAMALIVADCQWPSTTSPHNYAADATTLITAIKDHELQPTTANGPYQLNNGDQWGFGNNCRNPSYQAPAYYQCYASYVPSQAAIWGNAYTAGYALINANVNTTTGLVSNWSDHTGASNSCNGPNEYGWDACRNPWRMATDVIWHDDANAKVIITDLAAYLNGIGAANANGPVPQTGGVGSFHNATFVSTFAAGLVGADASYQGLLDAMYTETLNTVDAMPAYFGNTLRVLNMFVMTGNFWKPCSGNACPVADLLATPISGTNPLLVSFDASNSMDADGDILTYTWDFGDSNMGTGATPNHTYTTAGNYTATLSVDDGNGCIRTETVVITVYDNTPQPPVAIATADIYDAPTGTTINFDGTDSYDLNGDMLTYTWDFGDGTTGTGAMPNHSYTMDGTYTVTLTVDDGNGGTDTTTIIIVIDSTSCIDFIVEYRDQQQDPSNNQNEPGFRLVNNTGAAVPLSEFTIRYWFTREGSAAQQTYVDYADAGVANVTTNINAFAPVATGADHYLEVGFTAGAGNLAANSGSIIQTRFNKTDWTNYDESDDYSYNMSYSSFTQWENIGLYRNGILVCGNEPSSATRIQIKVFLQGPYNGSDMNTDLESGTLIPLSQPFNTGTMSYTGTETATSIPADVVDWVLIEVRDAATNTTVLARRACFVKKDGNVVELDGSTGVEFMNLNVSSGYIVVRHRNHLGIMTNGVISF